MALNSKPSCLHLPVTKIIGVYQRAQLQVNLTQQLDITLVMIIFLGNCFHVCVCCVFTLCMPALVHQLLGTLLSASHVAVGALRVQTHMTSPGFQRVLRIQTQATQSWQVLYSAMSPPSSESNRSASY